MRSLPLVFAFAAMSFTASAFPQHDHAAAAQPAAPTSEAQKQYATLKTLAGSWEGTLTTVPAMKGVDGTKAKVVLRVTSRGNAIMHEMVMAGHPDDPITMLYLDGDRLALTHYCDAGNRPRMYAKESADGKIAFEFTDLSGSDAKGHMADTAFTIVDPNHHIEEWTYVMPGGAKGVVARFDLQRTKDASGAFGQ